MVPLDNGLPFKTASASLDLASAFFTPFNNYKLIIYAHNQSLVGLNQLNSQHPLSIGENKDHPLIMQTSCTWGAMAIIVQIIQKLVFNLPTDD